MKYLNLFSALLLAVILVFATAGFAGEHQVNWDAFSKNLVEAIKSGNPGLQQSAMQRIIQYSDKLDVEQAVWHIAQIFRFDDNSRFRRLAMVTLYKINSDKAIYYVNKYIPKESEECLKRQDCCILQSYAATQQSEQDQLVASK